MTVPSNGTEANEIVKYAFTLMGKTDAGKRGFAISVKQAKTLLQRYSKKEIINVIDYTMKTKKKFVFSFGFFFTSMDVLHEEYTQYVQTQETAESVKQQAAAYEAQPRKEAMSEDESSERNRRKAGRTHAESRLGEKYSFDMLTR